MAIQDGPAVAAQEGVAVVNHVEKPMESKDSAPDVQNDDCVIKDAPNEVVQ